MSTTKIITGIILFCIVSFGLLYGIPKIIPMEMAEAYAGFATPTLAYGLAVVIGGGYLVLSYRKAYSQTEIPQKKYEFYYATFDEEQKKILDAMTEEDKRRFVEEYEKVVSEEKKLALTNNLFDWTHGFIPKGLKPVRTVVKLLMVGCVAWTGFAAYEALEPSFETYTANVTKTLEDQTLYIDGLPPIVLVGDGKLRQKDVENFIDKNIKTQPAFLLSCANSINIYSPDIYDSTFKSNSLGHFSSELHIKITTDMSTMTHELCHGFDETGSFVDQEYSNYSFTPEFLSYYNASPNSISEYGATNNVEFFAVGGEMYVNNPEGLKVKNMDVYNYFNKLFGPYMS